MAVASWEITLTYEDYSLPFGELEFKGIFSHPAAHEALRRALDEAYERFDVPLAKCTEVRMDPYLKII